MCTRAACLLRQQELPPPLLLDQLPYAAAALRSTPNHQQRYSSLAAVVCSSCSHLQLLQLTLGNTAELEEQAAGGGGLARVHMAADDDGKVPAAWWQPNWGERRPQQARGAAPRGGWPRRGLQAASSTRRSRLSGAEPCVPAAAAQRRLRAGSCMTAGAGGRSRACRLLQAAPDGRRRCCQAAPGPQAPPSPQHQRQRCSRLAVGGHGARLCYSSGVQQRRGRWRRAGAPWAGAGPAWQCRSGTSLSACLTCFLYLQWCQQVQGNAGAWRRHLGRRPPAIFAWLGSPTGLRPDLLAQQAARVVGAAAVCSVRPLVGLWQRVAGAGGRHRRPAD